MCGKNRGSAEYLKAWPCHALASLQTKCKGTARDWHFDLDTYLPWLRSYGMVFVFRSPSGMLRFAFLNWKKGWKMMRFLERLLVFITLVVTPMGWIPGFQLSSGFSAGIPSRPVSVSQCLGARLGPNN